MAVIERDGSSPDLVTRILWEEVHKANLGRKRFTYVVLDTGLQDAVYAEAKNALDAHNGESTLFRINGSGVGIIAHDSKTVAQAVRAIRSNAHEFLSVVHHIDYMPTSTNARDDSLALYRQMEQKRLDKAVYNLDSQIAP